MEKQLDLVLVFHLEHVLDQHAPRALVELHQAAVLDRVLQAHVAVVPALEAVLLRRGEPQAAAGARVPQPHEVAARHRLVEAVDAHRVVRGGAAEVLAPALLRVVGVGAGIDEELAPAHRERHRERVGVPVRRDRAVAERPGVGHHAQLPGRVEIAAQHHVAALGKGLAQRQARALRVERLEARVGALAEQPARAVVEALRLELEVAALEQHRPEREQRAVRARARGKLARPPVVGVADHRHVAPGVHHRGDEIHHRLDARLVVGGEPLAVRLAGEQAQHQQVEHELLVPQRLLAVHAVGGVLRQELLLEDAPGARQPVARLRPARPGQRGEEQPRRLADEVVVRGGVQREPAADERGVLVDRAQPEGLELRAFFQPFFSQELPGARPAHQAQRHLQRARPVRPVAVGAGEPPAFQMLLEGEEIFFVSRQGKGLRQRHQVQVAVGLPQVLDVAHQVAIAVVERLAEGERRFDARLGIAVPARRRADVDRTQREHVEPAIGDALGGRDIGRGVDLRRAMNPSVGNKIGMRRRRFGRGDQPRALGARLQLAQHAVGDLRRAHAAQPVQPPGELALQASRYLRCQISRFRSVHSSSSCWRRPERCSSSTRSRAAGLK